MSTPVETPTRTPETPAVIARELAAVTCAPVESFGAFINDDYDDGRGKLFQRLMERLTADKQPRNLLTTDQEIEIHTRLTEAMSTDEDRALFGQYVNHRDAAVLINEDAVFLTGVEVGRRAQGGQPEASNPKPEAKSPSTTTDSSEDVSEVMIRLVSALWLAKSVVDCQIGKDADVHEHGWWALTELLESAATDLDAAHDRYCTESNALHAAAESGGAA